MTLSETHKSKLEKRGILFLEIGHNSCRILKMQDGNGNTLPGYTSVTVMRLDERGELITEITSNMPVMTLSILDGQYILSCWDWIPGPGPGDFEKTFDKEEDVMNFITSYYFGFNDYFEAKKAYETLKLAK